MENLIQATFQYRADVSFKSQMESIIPKIFQGLLERQFICQYCNYISRVQEPFLDLSLNMSVKMPDQDRKRS